jgi:hypothetical protein
MTDLPLYSQISSLPPDLKKEVSEFVEFLTQKAQIKTKPKERIFGYSKDFFKILPDFGEPLDDFKNYIL